MPKINLFIPSSLSAKESFLRVKKILNEDQELLHLDPKIVCHFDEEKMQGQAKGSHFQADLSVTSSSSGSNIKIDVDLPFHLALTKGMVQKILQKKVNEALLG